MFLSAALIQLFFTDAPDVRNVVGCGGRLTTPWIVITLVQAQMLRRLLRIGSTYDYRVDGLGEQLRIRHVGAAQSHAKYSALAVDDQAAFRAVFPAIRGVRSGLPPPKRALPMKPSADCQVQATAPRPSQ